MSRGKVWISSCSIKVPEIVHLNSISSSALVIHLRFIVHLSVVIKLLICRRGSQSSSFVFWVSDSFCQRSSFRSFCGQSSLIPAIAWTPG